MKKRTPDAGSAAPSSRYRSATATRRIGYSLLPGDSFSYILHLRPREWPIMVGHTALGYFLAVGLNADALRASWTAFASTLVIWVLMLNGGTLALNSAFDADDGDIGYLDAPPPAPPRLAHFALILLFLGQLLSLVISSAVALAYFACFALSVLYSVPPFRLKAVAGVDWLINFIGFGALTPLAGWLSSGVPLASSGLLAISGFATLFAGFYPLTQIYQISVDRARGDNTLAIALGTRTSLVIALALTCLAFLMFTLAVARAGRPLAWAVALLPAALAWFLVLIPWLRHWKVMTDAEHKQGMYRSLGAWALTDLMVLMSLLI